MSPLATDDEAPTDAVATDEAAVPAETPVRAPRQRIGLELLVLLTALAVTLAWWTGIVWFAARVFA